MSTKFIHTDLRIKHHIDAPSGTEFLYRVKKLFDIQKKKVILIYSPPTKLRTESIEMGERVNELREMNERARLGGGVEAIEKQHKSGKLTAHERVEILFDSGSFVELDPFVTQRCTEFGMTEKKHPGDGVVTGYGTVDGRLVFAYAQDFTYVGGSLGEMHSKKIQKVMELSVKMGAPIIGLSDSGGARIQEGVESLAGYGRILYENVMASGVVPQISAIMGPCAEGAVYSPALTDFIFMVKNTDYMFTNGPKVVKEATGEDVTTEALGGPGTHASLSGVAHMVAENDEDCLKMIRKLLSYLPSNNLEDAPVQSCDDPADRADSELVGLVPTDPTKAYDMYDLVKRVIDRDSFYEVHKDFAPNAITGFARLLGRSVGIIANQPKVYAGCINIDSSDKIARFVRFCDCFNLPIITFQDVPGYLPDVKQEYGGIIRHGVKIIYAYSEASVPKITVIVKKSYGGAYVTMCSKHLGADMVFALPTSEIAVMEPEGAAEIVFKKELAEAQNSDEARQRLTTEYRRKFASPYIAASRGYVDRVIEPQQMRPELTKDSWNAA